jgi:nicotinate phosphoribosyltransferase
MPEGTVFFADEPIVRVTAPLREAQLVESRAINLLHFETLVASKAVRCALAAPGRVLVDFGLRRAHGAEAGLLSARATYLAGFAGTATVEAGRAFGIPLFGTMAHSYVQAHADEASAFEAFARARQHNAVLLIDTYDTERAAHAVVTLARRLAGEGLAIQGVRIDSGDLAALALRVRAILDAGGFPGITIFASGNLDELRLRDLVRAGAPIDGFGVGTRVNTSADAPYLDCGYKLQEYDGVARRKRSVAKATWPGRKQVYRRCDAEGQWQRDVVTLLDDVVEGTPLLQPVMRGGRLVAPLPSLDESRTRLQRELGRLPAALTGLDPVAPPGPVISPSLVRLAEAIDART